MEDLLWRCCEEVRIICHKKNQLIWKGWILRDQLRWRNSQRRSRIIHNPKKKPNHPATRFRFQSLPQSLCLYSLFFSSQATKPHANLSRMLFWLNALLALWVESFVITSPIREEYRRQRFTCSTLYISPIIFQFHY